jgi:hypothetical protein
MDPRTADKEGYICQPCAYAYAYDPFVSMPYSTSDSKQSVKGTFAEGTQCAHILRIMMRAARVNAV